MPAFLRGAEPGRGDEVGPPGLHVVHRAGAARRGDELAHDDARPVIAVGRVIGVHGPLGHRAAAVGP